MKQQSITIPGQFPLKTLIKMAWFFPLTLSMLVFFMTTLEQTTVVSQLLTTVIGFFMMLIVNFISIFFLLMLSKRNLKSGKMVFYSFLLTTIVGAVLMNFSDMLVNYLNQIHLITYVKKYDLSGFRFIFYLLIKSGLLCYLTLMCQGFVISQNASINTDLENAALKVTNAHAANQLLRQQIHPHFLFNALSTIKSLIYKQPDVAANYVVKLSSFLRASISATHTKTDTLAEEIRLSLDYLELQKIRLGSSLQYTIDIEEKYLSTTCLPVFSLQSLVENAIKHNLHSEAVPLSINITANDGIITVKNSYNPHYNQQNSLGSGLNNLSERYSYLSGERINFHHDDLHFYVSLKLIPVDYPA